MHANRSADFAVHTPNLPLVLCIWFVCACVYVRCKAHRRLREIKPNYDKLTSICALLLHSTFFSTVAHFLTIAVRQCRMSCLVENLIVSTLHKANISAQCLNVLCLSHTGANVDRHYSGCVEQNTRCDWSPLHWLDWHDGSVGILFRRWCGYFHFGVSNESLHLCDINNNHNHVEWLAGWLCCIAFSMLCAAQLRIHNILSIIGLMPSVCVCVCSNWIDFACLFVCFAVPALFCWSARQATYTAPVGQQRQREANGH